MFYSIRLTVHIVGVCPWILLLSRNSGTLDASDCKWVLGHRGDEVGTLLGFDTWLVGS